MASKRYNLPHLAFFQGFEAAARTLSFTKAAEDDGFPGVQDAVLALPSLRDPEVAAEAFDLETGAVLDREQFAGLEMDRHIERSSHDGLLLHEDDACGFMGRAVDSIGQMPD